jgi:hypothetical protein
MYAEILPFKYSEGFFFFLFHQTATPQRFVCLSLICRFENQTSDMTLYGMILDVRGWY